MELLSVFKTENQRELLTSLLPGAIASWPYTYLIVHSLPYDVQSALTEWTIIPIVLGFLLVSWGTGLFLTDVASNIEVRLEMIFLKLKTTPKQATAVSPFSLKDNTLATFRLLFGWLLILFNCWELLLGKFVRDRINDKSVDQLSEEFYDRWARYLAICISTKEPVIVKYYRGILNRFRFELTIIAAICIMLLGHLAICITHEQTSNIDWGKTSLYLGILIVILTFLFIEAFKGIELLHDLRQELIDTCSEKS
ncbi:hypothetical protein [Ohtaekwangia koreensis]|uniref:Uncharacterized protein n=1 Tax=Ohtaekwangia koreensis TaxID=688867 RepID=A0A1T5L892_9BACT|nr:hypothetical protein [Ohtaekwangia koreensis]SKC72232.1 hypothetical protein SAMN05660236_2741 [Ohtaekwangia koreensis]